VRGLEARPEALVDVALPQLGVAGLPAGRRRARDRPLPERPLGAAHPGHLPGREDTRHAGPAVPVDGDTTVRPDPAPGRHGQLGPRHEPVADTDRVHRDAPGPQRRPVRPEPGQRDGLDAVAAVRRDDRGAGAIGDAVLREDAEVAGQLGTLAPQLVRPGAPPPGDLRPAVGLEHPPDQRAGAQQTRGHRQQERPRPGHHDVAPHGDPLGLGESLGRPRGVHPRQVPAREGQRALGGAGRQNQGPGLERPAAPAHAVGRSFQDVYARRPVLPPLHHPHLTAGDDLAPGVAVERRAQRREPPPPVMQNPFPGRGPLRRQVPPELPTHLSRRLEHDDPGPTPPSGPSRRQPGRPSADD